MAARILVLSTTARVEHEFAHHGYLDVHVSVTNRKDSSNRTVEYSFTAEPGEIYHLKTVSTPDFTERQQRDFERTGNCP